MAIHDEISRSIDRFKDRAIGLGRQIHAHPELKFEERFAAGLLTGALGEIGVEVERGVAGLETAFRAETGKSDRSGPTVAILAEYDALPNGHSCGHNLICTAALAAFAGLAALRAQLPGRIVILGTPAEEGGGGKIIMLEKGALKGVDVAMMAHPVDGEYATFPTLATRHLHLTFHGHASHAAAAPWAGASALAAVIQTFQSVDAARLHFRDGSRIHGIITNGGQAVNIIPEKAECEFLCRAQTTSYTHEIADRVLRCAEAAAAGHRNHARPQNPRGLQEHDQQRRDGPSLCPSLRDPRRDGPRRAARHADWFDRYGRREPRPSGDSSDLPHRRSGCGQLPRGTLRKAYRHAARLRGDDPGGEGDGAHGVRFARGAGADGIGPARVRGLRAELMF
jgi:amidohydrolase